ncbi:MAG: hypothetical protein HeimC3_32350 [Candidatus Heimdallarchaeota archaeon LC_3]|nr:MAG: hypothetical protein HeimC3_32350 [Candidatus Heimdallarchaeota archaeon LC_3]
MINKKKLTSSIKLFLVLGIVVFLLFSSSITFIKVDSFKASNLYSLSSPNQENTTITVTQTTTDTVTNTQTQTTTDTVTNTQTQTTTDTVTNTQTQTTMETVTSTQVQTVTNTSTVTTTITDLVTTTATMPYNVEYIDKEITIDFINNSPNFQFFATGEENALTRNLI